MYPYILLLHLVGSAIWLGGHLVLALAILPRALKRHNPSIVLDFEEGFERLGIPALIVQVITGLWLAHRLIPNPVLWFTGDSPQALAILLKLVLLVATVGLAVHARLRIVPKLDRGNLQNLAWHIVAVTVFALVFVILGVAIRTGGF